MAVADNRLTQVSSELHKYLVEYTSTETQKQIHTHMKQTWVISSIPSAVAMGKPHAKKKYWTTVISTPYDTLKNVPEIAYKP